MLNCLYLMAVLLRKPSPLFCALFLHHYVTLVDLLDHLLRESHAPFYNVAHNSLLHVGPCGICFKKKAALADTRNGVRR